MDITKILTVGLILISNLILGGFGGPLNYVYNYAQDEIVGNNANHVKKMSTKQLVHHMHRIVEATTKETTRKGTTHTRDVRDVDKMSLRQLVIETHRIMEATPIGVVKGLGYVYRIRPNYGTCQFFASECINIFGNTYIVKIFTHSKSP